MPKFSTLEAVKITQVSRSRIDQMISRGFLELRNPPKPGKGREFGTNELAEIMALDALISMGVDVGTSELMRYMPLKIIHFHVPEPTLMVVRRHNRLIPTSDRGRAVGSSERKQTMRFGSTLCLENGNRAKLNEILADEDLIGVCAIPLKEILLRADPTTSLA